MGDTNFLVSKDPPNPRPTSLKLTRNKIVFGLFATAMAVFVFTLFWTELGYRARNRRQLTVLNTEALPKQLTVTGNGKELQLNLKMEPLPAHNKSIIEVRSVKTSTSRSSHDWSGMSGCQEYYQSEDGTMILHYVTDQRSTKCLECNGEGQREYRKTMGYNRFMRFTPEGATNVKTICINGRADCDNVGSITKRGNTTVCPSCVLYPRNRGGGWNTLHKQYNIVETCHECKGIPFYADAWVIQAKVDNRVYYVKFNPRRRCSAGCSTETKFWTLSKCNECHDTGFTVSRDTFKLPPSTDGWICKNKDARFGESIRTVFQKPVDFEPGESVEVWSTLRKKWVSGNVQQRLSDGQFHVLLSSPTQNNVGAPIQEVKVPRWRIRAKSTPPKILIPSV